jgi:hypothetical protein
MWIEAVHVEAVHVESVHVEAVHVEAVHVEAPNEKTRTFCMPTECTWRDVMPLAEGFMLLFFCGFNAT